jgi:cytochrome c5
MVYQSITLLASLFVLLVLGLLLAGLWGDTVKDWFRSAPEPVARRAVARPADAESLPQGGTDELTGLAIAPGYEIVRGTCTACHSASLVTQNRATRDGWEQMIRWMQAKQGLWDLGEQENIILDYLAANYAPEAAGRRLTLDPESVEWYRYEQ